MILYHLSLFLLTAVSHFLTVICAVSLLLSYSDKLPEWINKFKAEGMTEEEINDIIKGKAEKYIGKWGNHSKVGVLLNRYDNEQKMRDEF